MNKSGFIPSHIFHNMAAMTADPRQRAAYLKTAEETMRREKEEEEDEEEKNRIKMEEEKEQHILLNLCSNAKNDNVQQHPAPFMYNTYWIDEDRTELIVIRDDLLCGGTKSRIVRDYLIEDIGLHYSEYVYVSNPYGGAQIALAETIKNLNEEMAQQQQQRSFTAVIFCEGEEEIGSPQIEAAKQLGAHYVFGRLAFGNAHYYVAQTKNHAVLLENGFRTPSNTIRLAQQMSSIREQFGIFNQAFCAVASGLLIESMQMADLAQEYYGVCVFGRPPHGMEMRHRQHVNAIIPALPFDSIPRTDDDLPPFPSALRYDAKVWRVMSETKKMKSGKRRILLWNVLA